MPSIPEGRLSDRYFRGSGTAGRGRYGRRKLVLQKYPTMSLDLVKRYFASNAGKLASFDSEAQGAGQIRLGAMLAKVPQWSYTGRSSRLVQPEPGRSSGRADRIT